MKTIQTLGKIHKKIVVDNEDFEQLNRIKWYVREGKKTFYAVTVQHIKGKKIGDKGRNFNMSMHRYILGLKKGDGKHTDHIDGNGLNNQRSNLRIVTNQQNCWNKKHFKGYLGVQKCCNGNEKWTVRMNYIHYGNYDNPKIAALVYDKVARKLRGEFAGVNFPNERLPDDFLIVNFDFKPKVGKNKSGFQGVVWSDNNNSWNVKVRRKHYGYYKEVKIAALVYDEVSRKLKGKFAYVNFPNEKLPKGFLIPNLTVEARCAKNTSGVVGVLWHKATKNWRIIVKGKYYGYRDTLEEAVKKRKSLGEIRYKENKKERMGTIM